MNETDACGNLDVHGWAISITSRAHSRFAALVRSFDARNIMAGFLITMLRHGIAIFAERLRVAVRPRFHHRNPNAPSQKLFETFEL